MTQKKLLVVDDSETNLLLFDSMFEHDERVEVILRYDGVGIVDCCMEQKPDLILLDLMMPEVDGFEVLKLLQENQELNHIPVVIISALEGQEDIKKAIELGAVDFIIKPVDYEENNVMILKMLGLD
jgi:CheY-like chemotaxis protein